MPTLASISHGSAMKTSISIVLLAAAAATAAAVEALEWCGGEGARLASASLGLAQPTSLKPDWLVGRGVRGELRRDWKGGGVCGGGVAAAASAQTASGC